MTALQSRKIKLKKKKKVKFYRLHFKLSENRKNQLDWYCKTNNTTKNKVLRCLINDFLDENCKKDSEKGSVISKNQLKLFDVDSFYDKGSAQLTMDM